MTELLIGLIALGVGMAGGYAVFRATLTKARQAAQDDAERIRRAAELEAEAAKKQAILDGKAEANEERIRLDQKHQRRMGELNDKDRNRTNELNDRERKLKEQQSKLGSDQSALDRQRAEIKSKEESLAKQAEKNQKLTEDYNARLDEIRQRLEQVSGMTRDQARAELVESMVASARQDAGKRVAAMEEEIRETADDKARNIMALAMQRMSSDFAVERTVSVVNIPDDKVKGRIIGREGRNIRTFEMLTGVDLIIDDTPDAVVLSSHSPLRREIARLSLERLIEDGRIHPGRIEELIRQVTADTERYIKEQGQKAVFDLDLKKMHPELIRYMGINMYRTSYSQNILAHSVEVGFMCGIMAAEIGVNQTAARRAGFLHDIGKAVDKELEGPHAEIGAELCKRFGEAPEIVQAVAQHHNDRPETALGVLVQVADSLSAARPGARREVMTSYISRLDDLERIATKHKGVERAFAIQAGRELRIMVEAERVNDDEAYMISSEVAREIENTMNYPGQIKVTVLRETRAVNYAK